MASTLLEIRDISKRYPGVLALDAVSLTLESGRIHALVGENGAGKSTLIKILAGVITPDSGEILLDDSNVHIPSTRRARDLGFAVVHQHSHLIPDLSVAENYALRLGYPRNALGSIRWRNMRRDASKALEDLLPTLDVGRSTRFLSGVEKQLVEIGFALAGQPRVLILDEPTAVLPQRETYLLFDLLRSFAVRGGSVLFVSHRLDEVFQIAQEVTVLRDGKPVWKKNTSDTNKQDLIRGMVGRSVDFERDPTCIPQTEESLVVDNLSDVDEAISSISLKIRRGEVYGIYGLVGAGQDELCHALFGLSEIREGAIELSENAIGKATPGERVRLGLGYVPSDRLTQGLFYQMTVNENMSLVSLDRLAPNGFIRVKEEREKTEEMIQRLSVKTSGPDQNVSNLSGGNQQKVLLGRWLRSDPNVLILQEPTQGVDVGAKGEIHKLILSLAKTGVSILLISSEIAELKALCHRIGILREGRLAAELDGDSATEHQILHAALPDSESKKSSSIADERKGFLGAAFHWLLRQREASIALVVVFLGIAFGLITPGFATLNNLSDVMVNNSILLIGALGVSLVILAGGIDISVGAIMGLSAVAAGLCDKAGMGSLPILGISLAVGLALGAFNGALSVFGRVHPIIITLGTLSILRAVLIQVTGGRWILNLSERVTEFGQAKMGGFSVLLIAGLLAALLTHFFLSYRVYGRRLYVLGGSRSSAEILGISPGGVLVMAFALCGVFMGLAGLLHAGRYGQVQTNVGIGFELKVIAAAVIGGTDIMGGKGTALGTLFGTVLIGLISNVLVLTHVSTFWEGVVVGAMILLAVGADVIMNRRQEQV